LARKARTIKTKQKIMNILSSNITLASGTFCTTSARGVISYNIASSDANAHEFVEFALELMGIDLKYSDFQRMTEQEKKAMLRDRKIEKILNK
jgi:hypothetical protein